jgi:hypothetical protein
MQQCRFADPVSAKQTDTVLRVNDEIDGIEKRVAAMGKRDRFEADKGHGQWVLP